MGVTEYDAVLGGFMFNGVAIMGGVLRSCSGGSLRLTKGYGGNGGAYTPPDTPLDIPPVFRRRVRGEAVPAVSAKSQTHNERRLIKKMNTG